MAYDNYFFHIGLHKTASTFLQKSVFPNWPGIRYLRHRNVEYFLRLPDEETYLISSEGLSGATFAPLDERCRGISRLAEMFPDANIIIGFRPHGGFVASLYSQYLRYGGNAPFDAFFSLTAPNDEVVWRRDDLCFRTLIESLESAFEKPPFVFLLEELRTNREGLFDDLAKFLGSPRPAPPTRSQGARNVSLGSWQGQLLRCINKLAGITHSPDGRNRPFPALARWRLDPTNLCLRVLGRLPAGPLVSDEKRRRIDEAYQEDWAFVVDYVKHLSYRGA